MGPIRIGRLFGSRYPLALTALVVVGLGFGLALARLAVGEPRTSSADYALLTARVYEKDHNLPAATERLKSVGINDPAQNLTEIARRQPTNTVDQSRDVQTLRDLAQAYGAAPESSAAPAASQPIWIVTLLVFALVIVFGAALFYRVLGLRLPMKSPSVIDSGDGVDPLAPRGARIVARMHAAYRRIVDPLLNVLRSSPRRATRGGAATPEADEDEVDEQAGGRFAGSRSHPGSWTNPSQRSSLASRGAARALPKGQMRFRSSYDHGDEPYDEIHPITDSKTLQMVGACGVSAFHHLPQPNGSEVGSGPRCWGFTAWVQDYIGDNQPLRSVGLVSKWAYLNCGSEIDQWLRSGQVDELRQVDSGSAVRLETANFSATLTVEEFEYGVGNPADAFVAHLCTQFDVTLRPRLELGAVVIPVETGPAGNAAYV